MAMVQSSQSLSVVATVTIIAENPEVCSFFLASCIFPKFNEPDIHKITVHELGIGLLRIRLLGLCNGDESLALVNPFTDQLEPKLPLLKTILTSPAPCTCNILCPTDQVSQVIKFTLNVHSVM